MSLKDEFDREYQPVLENMTLPRRLAADYSPVGCLVHREDREVWLLQGVSERRFVLKIDRAGKQNLEGEFALMNRLPRELEGRVPMPVDCFQEDGVGYLLRTCLPGQPLSDVWEPGDVQACVELGGKLCALLERLHSLDEPVIHRDIKPENIILAPNREVGLTDFGIARTYKEGQSADTIFMGTRITAPPEQYGYAQTDQRADIYSLGMTLRWMLTGSYDPEALEQGNWPEGLKQCINKATAFDPQNRYSSAGELGRALSRSLKRPRRKNWLLAAACAAAVLLGVALCRPQGGQAVEFDNALLEQAVRAELDKPKGTITLEDLERVERLAVVGLDLLGEEQNYRYMIHGYVDDVSRMEEPFGDISDLSLLAQMPNLKVLYLCQQRIKDLSPLKGLSLEELHIPDNQVKDLSPLEGMTTLRTLNLANNPIEDLSPLASLVRLHTLNLDSLSEGYVDSFAPLTGLSINALSLNFRFPRDEDWSPLEELDQVRDLKLWQAPEKAFQSLAGMDGLNSLNLGEFRGESLEVLWAPALDSISFLNGLGTLDGIEQLNSLRYLNIEGVEGLDLEPATQLPKLRCISFNNCKVMNYTPLLRVPTLEKVDAWDDLCYQELERDCPEGVRSFAIEGVS